MIQKITIPKSKKEHICMLCGCKIEKGEEYERRTIIHDGKVTELKYHTDCVVAAQELSISDGWDKDISEKFCTSIDDYIDIAYEDTFRFAELSYLDKVRLILKQLFKRKLT